MILFLVKNGFQKAHLDLQSKKSIASHFGTFQLTDESIDQPVIDLKVALKEKCVSENDFLILKEGESYTCD